MKIPTIISQIPFGSGYPLGPGGHLRHTTFTGAPGPYRKVPEGDFVYSYPGMIPRPDERNPFGGVLHNINYLA